MRPPGWLSSCEVKTCILVLPNIIVAYSQSGCHERTSAKLSARRVPCVVAATATAEAVDTVLLL